MPAGPGLSDLVGDVAPKLKSRPIHKLTAHRRRTALAASVGNGKRCSFAQLLAGRKLHSSFILYTHAHTPVVVVGRAECSSVTSRKLRLRWYKTVYTSCVAVQDKFRRSVRL